MTEKGSLKLLFAVLESVLGSRCVEAVTMMIVRSRIRIRRGR